MDSGNSSSMQSSSGGCGGGDQEEYDSRADQSISAFFNHNNNNTTTVSAPSHLDSLIANYFNTAWSTGNPLWSTTTTKPTDGSRPVPPPISSEPIFFTNPHQHNLKIVSNTNADTTSPICSVPTDKRNGLNNNMATTRNPKKRSRVSRRAPTTVLTTDTSNFRAMVQEFTGNPSTPFTGLSSSSFPRSRFDLFGSSSTSASSRPLKPFPHKLISQSTANHHYLNPRFTDCHHQSLLLDMNTQNLSNPYLNNQSPNNPLTNQSLLCGKSKPLSLRASTGFGHVGVGTNFEGLHNIIVSSSSTMTQPALNSVHGSDKNSEAENGNDLLRSRNGDDPSMVQSSDGYTATVTFGSENKLAVVRNEGMVGLSWISSD